jgi:AraC-like DNA-binding protein
MKLQGFPIVHFYSFSAESAHETGITAVPDGCVDVLFSMSEGGADGYIYGSVTKKWTMNLREGHRYFGVRFMPGTLPKNIGISIPELIDNHIALRDIKGCGELANRIAEAKGFEECVDILLRFIDNEWWPTDLLQMFISQIARHKGNVRIAKLEDETKYTARYINRVFTQQLGISPKAFANMMRFQSVIKKMNQSQIYDGATLAAEFGYFDQAHLIKEFKEFAAVTPGEYFSAVDLPNYGRQIVLLR